MFNRNTIKANPRAVLSVAMAAALIAPTAAQAQVKAVAPAARPLSGAPSLGALNAPLFSAAATPNVPLAAAAPLLAVPLLAAPAAPAPAAPIPAAERPANAARAELAGIRRDIEASVQAIGASDSSLEAISRSGDGINARLNAESVASAGGVVAGPALSPGDEAEARRIRKDAEAKIAVIKAIGRFLKLDVAKKDPGGHHWSFQYNYGKSVLRKPLNLEVELLVAELLSLDSEQLDRASREAISDKRFISLNPLINNRMGIEIAGTEFYHSIIMGNHNALHAKFYLLIDHKLTSVESLDVTDTRLEAVIRTYGRRQVLVIDKSGPVTKLRIGKGGPFVYMQEKRMRLANSEWHDEPLVTSQTHGI